MKKLLVLLAFLTVLSTANATPLTSTLAPNPGGRTAQGKPFKERYRKIEYMIPMRDGVKLYTAVYVPRDSGADGAAPSTVKHPILLERTGYGAGPYGPETYRGTRGSKKFEDLGYAFAWQDVRGRGQSEGRFVNDRPQLILSLKPFDIDESTDTYDTIDYLVKNVPNCNGRVGLWGISYPGFYAGVGAVNSHPALKAASPQAPVSGWFVGDDFHHHGAFFLVDSISFSRFGETPENASTVMRDRPRINAGADLYKFYVDKTLQQLTDTYFAGTDGLWKDLMEHGTMDEYWQSRDLPSNMKNVNCAVMTVGGWFDAEDCWGALHTYAGTEKLNPKAKNTLVMGPWFHGMWAGRAGGGQKFGDQDFGSPTSTYFQEEIEFPFFDTHLRGDGRVKMPEARMFETGANKWRTFSTWPPQGLKEMSFVFRSDGTIAPPQPVSSPSARAFGAQNPVRISAAAKPMYHRMPEEDRPPTRSATPLSLSTEPTRPGPSASFKGALADFSEYVSDPADPVPHQGGTIRSRTREYMIDDQRFATARKDVLSYQTDPMAKPITVAGPVQADLFVTTTSTDADFVVKVIDVFPDDAPGKLAGYQMLVRAEVMRAKFRNSYMNPQPLTPGTVETVSFELPDILHTFLPGHRMMVQVQSSWFPLVDRNPQKFVDIYHCKPEDFQKATIQVHHRPGAASRIRVGVLP